MSIDPYEGMSDDELDRHFASVLRSWRLRFAKPPHIKQPPSELSKVVAKVRVWIGKHPGKGN